MKKEQIIKSTCGMCFSGCGVLVHVKNDKVIEIKGDPDSPVSRGVICPKGPASAELCYHPDRLRHPLKRAGERGAGKWEKISWNEALDTVADALTRIRDKYGIESISFMQGSAKGLIDNYNERFANVLGAANFSSTGHVCFLPRFFASRITCGSFTVPDYEHPPACVLVWGANLAETRIGEHHRLARQLKKGIKLIVIDPMRTILAKKAGNWLQLRPGTDLALALGMIHVIINDELYDREFVDQYTVGFKRLKSHVQKYSPEMVSEIIWIPADVIRETAKVYAAAESACIQWGNAIDHGINSFQTARALTILKAVTGNLDQPGGDLFPCYPLAGPGSIDVTMKNQMSGDKWDKRVSVNRKLIPTLRRVLPNDLTRAIIKEDPYPIRFMYVHAANPLISGAKPKQFTKAFHKLDFMAVADFFMTPTAALADIVLPAATYLEYDSISATPYYPFVQIQQKAISIEECRSDIEIKNELAKRLGMQEYFNENIEDFLDEMLKPSGLTFDDFRKKGVLVGDRVYRKFEKNGFDTPSGKVELYSETLEKMGYQPMPDYIEPPETHMREPGSMDQYPLVMTSKKSVYYLHSSGKQIKSLREKYPEPVVMIHHDTATNLSIEQGDPVYIETKLGRIKQKAVLTDQIDPRVVIVDYGWWFPEQGVEKLFGWEKSNINILIDDDLPGSAEMGSVNFRGVICRVYKCSEVI